MKDIECERNNMWTIFRQQDWIRGYFLKKKKKIGQKVTDSSDVMDSVWDRGDKTKPYSMTFLAILPKWRRIPSHPIGPGKKSRKKLLNQGRDVCLGFFRKPCCTHSLTATFIILRKAPNCVLASINQNSVHSREDRLRVRKVNRSFCLVYSSTTIMISF